MRAWTIAVMSALLLLLAAPAHAGGSWLEGDVPTAQPGDEVVISGLVYRGQLGWLEHGPFVLTLRPASTEASGRGRVPSDVVVGEFETKPAGAHAVEVQIVFRVPQLKPGSYSYGYCNDPCTTGLGDLIGVQGTLEVLPATGTLPRTGSLLPVRSLLWPALLSMAIGTVLLVCRRRSGIHVHRARR